MLISISNCIIWYIVKKVGMISDQSPR